MNKHVVLVGMTGSGKTTVGKLLAEQTGRPLFDTDEIIEKTENRSITEIFESEGEAYFRKLETKALDAALNQGKPVVISTGGGIVIVDENRKMIRERSFSIYLKADLESLKQRLSKAAVATRPLLKDDPFNVLEQLINKREPWYAMAEWTVPTDSLSPEQITK